MKLTRDAAMLVDRVAEWVHEAPRVLIGAGAGLSVAAGIDYTDTESFARLYPAMTRQGFRACYELIGRHSLPPALFWGYWGLHVQEARFTPKTAPVYQALRDLTQHKNVFVVTSNVDALFTRHGFEADRVWSPQGDFAHMHCTSVRQATCEERVWNSQPTVQKLLHHLDPREQEIVDTNVLPTCDICGGRVFFNVREDATFVEAPYAEQGRRCVEWIRDAVDESLLILEIGAGFNTPGVVRWPLERLAVRHPGARFVRVNRDHPSVPPEISERAIGIGGDAGAFVNALSAVAR